MLDQFPETDAALYQHIRDRANHKPVIKWEVIAEELGVTVGDLLDWFVSYRAPKHDKRSLVTAGGRSPMLMAARPGGTQFTLSNNSQRFINWRKATAGARQARLQEPAAE